MESYDVIIIGAGPAGMSAAVYASRAGLKTAMLEMSAPGGKMVKTAEVENWPGTIKTSGVDLALKMFEHSTAFGANYLYGVVSNIYLEDEKKIIECEDGNKYESKAVIIATGTQERLLNIPGEKEFTGKGVSYCAVCDGSFYKEKVVTVVGGGNSALEEAIYLSKMAAIVNVVIRRDEFRAEKHIQDQVLNNEKINIIKSSIPVEVKGNDFVEGLVIKNVKTNEISTIKTDAIFPFIGLDPVTGFVEKLNICDEKGYIIVNEKMETAVKGIYGAGDVCAKQLRQIVTATSDGAIAAQQAFHYINN